MLACGQCCVVQMPSQWFKQKYFSILDNCYEVAENQPAELDNMFNVNGNNELRNMGKIKSFLTYLKGTTILPADCSVPEPPTYALFYQHKFDIMTSFLATP